MKPKLVLSALCAGIAFLLVSCDKPQSPPPQPPPQQTQQPQQQAPPPEPQQAKGEIQISLVKTEQRYNTVALMDFQIYNNSDVFVSVCNIEIAFYNQNGEYLGKSYVNTANLRPKQSSITTGIFDGKANEVVTWKPQDPDIQNKDNNDITANFQLTIMQTPGH